MRTAQAGLKSELCTPKVKNEIMGAYSEADYDKIDLVLESPGSQPKIFVNKRVLNTFGLVAITYLVTTGGPTGSEPVISAAGPLIGILCFILYPFVYAAPYAYVVAELCSIFPEDGGFAVWVLNAFGPFWGFQVGFWSWISCVFDTALMPGLILRLFMHSFSWNPSETTAYLVKTAIAMVFASFTLLGTKFIGRISISLLLLMFVPFLIFTVWAYATATEFKGLFQIRHESNVYNEETKEVEQSGAIDIQWATLINMLYLNYSNIHVASVFGGEVSNPARAYPHAIWITIVLTVLTCLIPIPAAVCSNDVSWAELDSDSYANMGYKIGGSALEALMVLASVCSFGGQYTATLYAQAFMISGMAENELIPFYVGVRNATFGSPHVAIVGTVAISLALLNVELYNLIAMANIFSVAVQLLIVATAILLRSKLPYVARPSKVPGGTATLYVMGLLPLAMFVYIAIEAFLNGTTAVISISLVVVGIGYGFFQHRRHRLSM